MSNKRTHRKDCDADDALQAQDGEQVAEEHKAANDALQDAQEVLDDG